MAQIFLKGWRSLPDELKLHVLSFAIPSGLAIDERAFSKKIKELSLRYRKPEGWLVGYYDPRTILYCTALPFLGNAEIAQLAFEVLYKQNIIHLNQFSLSPPLSARSHIRNLSIATEPYYETFDKLRSLFHGSFDYPNLALVTIEFLLLSGYISADTVSAISHLDAIRIRTNELHVSFQHGQYNNTDELDEHIEGAPSNDEIAAAVLLGFTVDSQRNLDSGLERYIYDSSDKGREHKTFVKTWPDTWVDERVTRRVVKVAK